MWSQACLKFVSKSFKVFSKLSSCCLKVVSILSRVVSKLFQSCLKLAWVVHPMQWLVLENLPLSITEQPSKISQLQLIIILRECAEQLALGKLCFTSTSTNPEQSPPHIPKVNLVLLRECAQQLAPGKLCAVGKDLGGPCPGDSGSPLLVIIMITLMIMTMMMMMTMMLPLAGLLVPPRPPVDRDRVQRSWELHGRPSRHIHQGEVLGLFWDQCRFDFLKE